MSTKRVGTAELTNAIMSALEDYDDEVKGETKEAVQRAAASCRDQIKANAPKKSGKYRAGWTVTKNYENSTELRVTVHNKNRYQLAHLLEFGHVKANGGRVAAIPHIAPAAEAAEEQLVDKIQLAIRG